VTCAGRSPAHGGYTFAEHPEVMASGANLIWCARIDPGALEVEAYPAAAGDIDAFDPVGLERWLSLVPGERGQEHAVLSDGLRRIRLDVIAGSLTRGPVLLHYRLAGTASLRPRMLPLRRLLALCTHRRFVQSLFPPDPRVERWIETLRVHDAVADGASISEIVEVLFGTERVRQDEARGSDSLKSRVRRMARDARSLAAGGYRLLMRGGL